MQSSKKSSLMALAVGAMGVVYGDIGTSVLYAIKEIFNLGLVDLTPNNVYGILSILFWTITIIVSIKYIGLILRADNNGEGGLIALLSLASQSVTDKPRLHRALLTVGIFGACLFYGDGVITPAISVLSAVEGFALVWHDVENYIVPVTLLILLILFVVQKRGTGGIGRFFGPITVLWFLVLAILGVWNIAKHPEILWALNPWHAVNFIVQQPGVAFALLGAVILVATGTEALYADLGHFGRAPIRLAWFGLVMPALTLNYFGQGALLLGDPSAARNPFFLMAPEWALLPLAVLATMTTVIASQALITGAFSVTKQAIQLGYLPRLRTLHTSVRELGQIYIPAVNWGLFVAIVLVVVMFRSSENLAVAYGVAVTTDMLITTMLTFVVIRYVWRLPLWMCIVPTLFFLLIDLAFWTSNLDKIFDGGWFPIAIALLMFALMSTWKRGRTLVNTSLRQSALSLQDFLSSLFLSPPTRVAGTAVFLSSDVNIVPNALLHNLKHNKVLHEQNLFVCVQIQERPWVPLSKRVEIESLGHDCWQVKLNFGFKNDLDVPKALRTVDQAGLDLDEMEMSYFVSRDIIAPTVGRGMALWREKLFAQMHANASSVVDYLKLPSNMVVELGSKIEI